MESYFPFWEFNNSTNNTSGDGVGDINNEKDIWQDEPDDLVQGGSSQQQRRWLSSTNNNTKGIKRGEGIDGNNNNDTTTMDDDEGQQLQQPKKKNQLNAFIEMAIPYFRESSKGRWKFIFLVVLMILNSAVRVVFSYLARDFWTALSEYDEIRFFKIIKQFLLSLTILAPINVFYRFQRQRLAISWREWMTNRVLSLYYSNRVYYSLELNMNNNNVNTTSSSTTSTNHSNDEDGIFQQQQQQDDYKKTKRRQRLQQQQQQQLNNQRMMMDNPDQRIAEDVKHFTEYSLSLFLTIAVSLIDLVAFSIILYTIKRNLFLSIIGFAVIGTIVTVYIGKSLVTLNFLRLRKEADFRYSLVRIRENAESIAFFDNSTTGGTATTNKNNSGDGSSGEGGSTTNNVDKPSASSELMMEGQYVATRFRSVISNAKDIIGTQRNLDFFTTFYDYLTWILPIIVVAPDYFNGLVEMGVVQQATAAFSHVLDDLSIIISEFESLSEFSAAIDRLYQFLSAIRQADPDRDEETVPLMSTTVMKESTTTEHERAYYTSPLQPPQPTASTTSPPGSETAFRRMDDDIFGGKTHKDVSDDDASNKDLEASVVTERTRTNIDLEQMPPMRNTPSQSCSSASNVMALDIQSLTLMTPDRGRTLIRNLNMKLSWGQRLLIVGPSGVGKSSLMRAIAGLWTAGSGSIIRPHKEDVYFLPQKPYCPLGNLRDQLLYPHTSVKDEEQIQKDTSGCITCDASLSNVDSTNEDAALSLARTIDDARLLQILNDIELKDLASRAGNGDPIRGLDAVLDWSNTLSLGEQQRLAFGRVLLHQPRLVILDESTSAMDVNCETKMYSLLSQLGRSEGGGQQGSTTYISVGHRPTLLSHHDVRLEIRSIDIHIVGPVSSTEGKTSTAEDQLL